MGKAFLRALLFWLGIFELVAGWRGWRGLSWRVERRERLNCQGAKTTNNSRENLGARFWPHVLPLLLAAVGASGLPRARWRRALSLSAAAPLALALQIGAASLRNRALAPLARLRPGPHSDRVVRDIHIGMAEGYLPAIEIAPRGGAKAAVCLLHGSGDHKTAYTWWMVDALLAHGIAALLVDMDGHGENPRWQRFPEMLEDVMTAVGWLRARYARVGVLGISLGGCVAARAIADGAPADAFVLMEAPPKLHFTRADMWREGLALLNPRVLSIFQDSTAFQIARTWSTRPIRAAISTWDLIDALDLLGSLARINVPLLALYGGSDAIVKPHQARQAQRALPPGAAFRLVPGASHLSLFLRREIQELIAAWFQQMLE
jgi:alpha-beta hydrolase superfamily lysophospholipase